ncbi:DUF2251 domain-containing protein [Hymenobacter nivis]|uniref:DUF2251 domain-containing protein n=1 Tax=Hymenobacter nivis TaxID=1850093 RepID=A0A2Z3GR48_9BACT|nr:DUF2251 domain-containing protein [Hymenobacter nivis]AWM34592.1 DUF2251 domain-containing protein [Hymenobacter nivis]
MQLGTEATVVVGTPDTLLVSTAAAGTAQVIFEDDGTTGYFCAVAPGPETVILDALHVADVADVADRSIPVAVQLFWTVGETAAALVINGHCHALYDFQRRAGFCRNAFPPAPHGQVPKRELTDELVEQYFGA